MECVGRDDADIVKSTGICRNLLVAAGPKYEHLTFSNDLSRAVRVAGAVPHAAFIRAAEGRADTAAGSRRGVAARRRAGAGSGSRGCGSAHAAGNRQRNHHTSNRNVSR